MQMSMSIRCHHQRPRQRQVNATSQKATRNDRPKERMFTHYTHVQNVNDSFCGVCRTRQHLYHDAHANQLKPDCGTKVLLTFVFRRCRYGIKSLEISQIWRPRMAVWSDSGRRLRGRGCLRQHCFAYSTHVFIARMVFSCERVDVVQRRHFFLEDSTHHRSRFPCLCFTNVFPDVLPFVLHVYHYLRAVNGNHLLLQAELACRMTALRGACVAKNI